MQTTPLTSTPAGTSERRLLGVLSLAALATLTLTACGGVVTNAFGRSQDGTASFASGTEAKADRSLPDWVPDSATDIRFKARAGGAERITAMRATLDDLPDDCVPVSEQEPLRPRPEQQDAAPSDFRTVSTLSADWWPAEEEQGATMMCGAWWVGEHDGVLYGFTPEKRTMPVG